MNPLTLPINAHHLVRAETHALLLDEEAPQQILRLAFVVRGTERHIFPALALDDWGREKSGPGLYRWLFEQGPQFPRAELFGFEASGAETQIFLRDLELSFNYPCYVYASSGAPVHKGIRLRAIFAPQATGNAGEILEIPPPEGLPWPLRRAAVAWRHASLQAMQEAGWQLLSA